MHWRKRGRSHPSRRKASVSLSIALLAMSSAIALAISSSSMSASAADPVANIAPRPTILGAPSACAGGSPFAPYESQPCVKQALAAINRARAIEHLRPMSLPASFTLLSQAQQEFVVTNAERVDRGLSALRGLCTVCDAAATKGAQAGKDPVLSPGQGKAEGYAAVWAGNFANTLVADYYWMYDDGWAGTRAGTPNVDCHSPTSQGCWDHRHALLSTCSSCSFYFGGGEAPSASNGFRSYGELLVAFDPSAQPATDPAPGPAYLVGSCRTPKSSAGYRMFAWPGGVTTAGSLDFCGSIDEYPRTFSSVVAGLNSPSGAGYFEITANGSVWGFGDANPMAPARAHIVPSSPVIAAAMGHQGYWLLTSSGQVVAYGRSSDLGSSVHGHQSPAVAISATRSGKGYWVVTRDGSIASFGDATRLARISLKHFQGHIVAMTRSTGGKGVWLLTSTGHVLSRGDAGKHPSAPALPGASYVGIAAAPHAGYWVLTNVGKVYALDGAPTLTGGTGGDVAIAS